MSALLGLVLLLTILQPSTVNAVVEEIGKTGVFMGLTDNALLITAGGVVAWFLRQLFDFGKWLFLRYIKGQESTNDAVRAHREEFQEFKAEIKASIVELQQAVKQRPSHDRLLADLKAHAELIVLREFKDVGPRKRQ